MQIRRIKHTAPTPNNNALFKSVMVLRLNKSRTFIIIISLLQFTASRYCGPNEDMFRHVRLKSYVRQVHNRSKHYLNVDNEENECDLQWSQMIYNPTAISSINLFHSSKLLFPRFPVTHFHLSLRKYCPKVQEREETCHTL